jgi:hypothetical protein
MWMGLQTSLKKMQQTVAIASSLATSGLGDLRWLRRSVRALPLKTIHSVETPAIALELTSTLNAVGRTISRHIAARCRLVYRIIGLKILNGIHDSKLPGGASVASPSTVQSHGTRTFISIPTHKCYAEWARNHALQMLNNSALLAVGAIFNDDNRSVIPLPNEGSRIGSF